MAHIYDALLTALHALKSSFTSLIDKDPHVIICAQGQKREACKTKSKPYISNTFNKLVGVRNWEAGVPRGVHVDEINTCRLTLMSNKVVKHQVSIAPHLCM